MSQRLKEKRNVNDWYLAAAQTLKPPEKMTVSEWSDKKRVLDEKTSAQPGGWRTSATPYLRGVMDSFNDPEIEEIIFVKPTQVGGTESLMNMIGYCIEQDPSSALVVYPTLDLAEYASKNRIQPMIDLCKTLKQRYYIRDSKILELQFDSMYLVLSGANSPASLASRPCRYLFLDEVDKYPVNAGKEADPISLARERTKTYAYNKKIFITSTPTLSKGNIWKAHEAADEQRIFYVPCPHCGHMQTLKFNQIKWVKDSTADEARDMSWYECEKCNAKITDSYKMQMLRAGEWKAVKKAERPRKVSFHINTIYSPWTRFGDIAYEFLKSKDFPELLQNFINSWLAEPWQETRQKMDADVIKERQSEYAEGIVPPKVLGLTGGADIQDNHIYWTIRAWGESLTSWNVAHGIVQTLDDLYDVMNLAWVNENNKKDYVQLCCIDSGDQTDTIYDFVFENSDWAIPVKGASREMFNNFKISTIDKVNSKAYGSRLVMVNTQKYKDMISSRMNKLNGKGSWMVYKEVDDEYCNQVTAEHKVIERKNGKEIEIWQKKTSHADNHYLDCEVYAFVAADLLQFRYIQLEEEKPKETLKPQENQENWIKTGGDWLNVGSK